MTKKTTTAKVTKKDAPKKAVKETKKACAKTGKACKCEAEKPAAKKCCKKTATKKAAK